MLDASVANIWPINLHSSERIREARLRAVATSHRKILLTTVHFTSPNVPQRSPATHTHTQKKNNKNRIAVSSSEAHRKAT